LRNTDVASVFFQILDVSFAAGSLRVLAQESYAPRGDCSGLSYPILAALRMGLLRGGLSEARIRAGVLQWRVSDYLMGICLKESISQ